MVVAGADEVERFEVDELEFAVTLVWLLFAGVTTATGAAVFTGTTGAEVTTGTDV